MVFPTSEDEDRIGADGIDEDQWERIWNAAAAASTGNATRFSVALREFQDDPRTRRDDVFQRMARYTAFLVTQLIQKQIGKRPDAARIETLTDALFALVEQILVSPRDDVLYVVRNAVGANSPGEPRRSNLMPVCLVIIGALAEHSAREISELRTGLVARAAGRTQT